MVQINFAHKEIQCKIVYYGPGMSGKTTNLELVHEKTPGESRGELTSIATTGERTLYFDYMPLDLGSIAGIKTKFQLYTVPGQIYYKSTRRLVLQGVDGIVFVADSSAAKLAENQESMRDLEENVKEMGRGITDLPIVIQYNKRDLPDAMSIEELQAQVNVHGFPHFEASAKSGQGVFPTLKALASLVLEAVNRGGIGANRAPKPATAPQPSGAGAPKISMAAPASKASTDPQEPARSAPRIAVSEPSHQAPAPAQAPRISVAASAATEYATSTATAVATRPAPAPVATPRAAPRPAATVVAQSAPAPQAAPEPAPKPKTADNRYVKVSNLGDSARSSKKLAFLGLGLLIAVAAWFAISRLG